MSRGGHLNQSLVRHRHFKLHPRQEKLIGVTSSSLSVDKNKIHGCAMLPNFFVSTPQSRQLKIKFYVLGP